MVTVFTDAEGVGEPAGVLACVTVSAMEGVAEFVVVVTPGMGVVVTFAANDDVSSRAP